MSTRKYTLTIPESLAARLDAWPGHLKLSAFLQEKLTEFLDAEEAKAVTLMNEQQSLSNRVHEMVMYGKHGSAYVAGRHQGQNWAGPMSIEDVIETRRSQLQHPYPLELGRPDLLPKSLLADDPRLKAYAEILLGPEFTQAITAGPEPVFMLPAEKKDEALAWISGWNDGVDDAYRDKADNGELWQISYETHLPPPGTRRQRRPDKKEKP
jgi:hypothetical protein